MDAKYEKSFYIYDLPKTINSIGRKHWAVKKKEAHRWHVLVLYCVSKHRPSKPLKKAKLHLIRFSTMSPDFDGLVSSFKHVIDGLVNARVLEDDKFSNIGQPTYEWKKAKPKEGKIWVEIKED